MVDLKDEEVVSTAKISVDVGTLKNNEQKNPQQIKSELEDQKTEIENSKAKNLENGHVTNGNGLLHKNENSDIKAEITSTNEISEVNNNTTKVKDKMKENINNTSTNGENVNNFQNGATTKAYKKEEIIMQINKKRHHVDKLTLELAAEEARYTVLKKIRLSQLSVENNKAELQKKKDLQEQARKESLQNRERSVDMDEDENENSNSEKNERGSDEYRPPGAVANNDRRLANGKRGHSNSYNKNSGKSTPNNRSSTPSSAFDKTFKPIQPDMTGKSQFGNTKVVAPTPLSHLDAVNRVKGRPTKSYTTVRDLDDIHQLAIYLAQNQHLPDQDKLRARKLVFKKQLNKILSTCPPIENSKPDIIFFPMVNSNEFVNLIGLEQVVNTIKLQNVKKKGGDMVIHGHLDNADDWKVKQCCDPGEPFECEICKTDFTPQWYENKDWVDETQNSEKSNEKSNDNKDKKPEKPEMDEKSEQDQKTNQDQPKKPKPSVFCQSCVHKHRQKANIKAHNKNLKKVFKEAYEHEKVMNEELRVEYDRQVKIYKEEEIRKQEAANRQILMLQKKQEQLAEKKKQEIAKANAEKARQQRLANAQAEQLKKMIEAQEAQQRAAREAQNKRKQQQQAQNSQNNNNSASATAQAQARLQSMISQPNMEVITKLMTQIEKSGVMNNASSTEMNKIIQILTQQMIQAGVQQPQELADLLRVMMTNMQNEKKRKIQEAEQQQAAARLVAQQAREAQERKAAERRAEQERKRRLAAEQEQQRKKKQETDHAIQSLLNVIANTADQNQQQQLLQVLLAQTNNNQEAQQRIIDQVVRMITQKNQAQGSSVRR